MALFQSQITAGGGGGGGVTDHGALTGLGDDDHAQYHTDARGDARYSPLGHTHPASGIWTVVSDADLGGATLAAWTGLTTGTYRLLVPQLNVGWTSGTLFLRVGQGAPDTSANYIWVNHRIDTFSSNVVSAAPSGAKTGYWALGNHSPWDGHGPMIDATIRLTSSANGNGHPNAYLHGSVLIDGAGFETAGHLTAAGTFFGPAAQALDSLYMIYGGGVAMSGRAILLRLTEP